jgi:hypothetical protein
MFSLGEHFLVMLLKPFQEKKYVIPGRLFGMPGRK